MLIGCLSITIWSVMLPWFKPSKKQLLIPSQALRMTTRGVSLEILWIYAFIKAQQMGGVEVNLSRLDSYLRKAEKKEMQEVAEQFELSSGESMSAKNLIAVAMGFDNDQVEVEEAYTQMRVEFIRSADSPLQ
eukprot:TRINITY_DN9996_c0_g3_i2.p1 TRINITY_DN9996_c0_g3~~TRINITY_DN9996_c0_g3_i2.p1  ORF type:complete len:132 (-),score=34.61 TRINITY_DN9996_c0_g3_i2:47-442(-)